MRSWEQSCAGLPGSLLRREICGRMLIVAMRLRYPICRQHPSLTGNRIKRATGRWGPGRRQGVQRVSERRIGERKRVPRGWETSVGMTAGRRCRRPRRAIAGQRRWNRNSGLRQVRVAPVARRSPLMAPRSQRAPPFPSSNLNVRSGDEWLSAPSPCDQTETVPLGRRQASG